MVCSYTSLKGDACLLTFVRVHPTVTKKDVEDHFKKHGAGEITEVKLMSGFGFIEYKDSLDAMDVVPGMISPPARSRENFAGKY